MKSVQRSEEIVWVCQIEHWRWPIKTPEMPIRLALPTVILPIAGVKDDVVESSAS